jgi:carbonic anhydrase/acetyltransferase-like protein (isoleucine patch superfamily)
MQQPLILPYGDKTPKFARDAFIAPNAVLIGDLEIGSQSSVWFGCVLRADVCHIRIGARSNVQDGTVIHVSSAPRPTLIGDDVLVGHLAILHACTLESGSFVGMRATVMDDAVIESGAMVAAGALVGPGKRIPRGELWAGTPARFMRKLTDADVAGIVADAAKYVEHAATYRKMLGA